MAMINIRVVKKEDINFVRDVSIQFNYSRDSNKYGFVEFNVPSEKEYLALMNPYFLVIEKNNSLIGFLVAYQSVLDTSDFDEIKIYLKKKYKDFIYLCQIAIIEAEQRKGYAKLLINELKKLCSKSSKKIFAGVHENNLPSKNLMESCGFKKIDNLSFDGLSFDIFKFQ